MAEFKPEDLAIKALGERTIISPLDQQFQEMAGHTPSMAMTLESSSITILRTLAARSIAARSHFASRRPARAKIFFRPEDTTCAIVTCGGCVLA